MHVSVLAHVDMFELCHFEMATKRVYYFIGIIFVTIALTSLSYVILTKPPSVHGLLCTNLSQETPISLEPEVCIIKDSYL